MRVLGKVSFCVFILGLISLLIILDLPARKVNLEEIEVSPLRQKISFQGFVEEQRSLGEIVLLYIEGIEVVCECEKDYTEKEIIVEGVVEEYKGKRQVRALKINLVGSLD